MDQELIYKDGKLLSGTFDALLTLFLPTPTHLPDKQFIFSFLLNGRLFVRPYQLLSELGQVTVYQDLRTEAVKVALVDHLIIIVEEWVLQFPYDFLDHKMLGLLKDICQNSIELSPRMKFKIDRLSSNLLQNLSALYKYEECLIQIMTDSTEHLQELPPACDILDVCPSSLTMAHQLTHVELDRLRFISAEEFVQTFAKENRAKLKTLCRETKRAKDLEAYVAWFNRLTYVVATEICTHVRRRNRVKVLEYFIDVAKECFNIGNFNSAMALIAGLNLSQVSRLRRTWLKAANLDKFEILEHQMDPANNFTCYRSTLNAAVWRTQGASDQREKIVVPFFSLFLKDLYFLNECSATKMPNGHINFEKWLQVARNINEFQSWKAVECPFPRQEPVIHYLLTSPIFSDEALTMASYACEPPDNEYEKMTQKQLKDVLNRVV